MLVLLALVLLIVILVKVSKHKKKAKSKKKKSKQNIEKSEILMESQIKRLLSITDRTPEEKRELQENIRIKREMKDTAKRPLSRSTIVLGLVAAFGVIFTAVAWIKTGDGLQ